MKIRLMILTAAVLLIAGSALAGTTLENLQAAYNGESNANAKYIAFAEKADKDGYAGVAALFRAAAKAEEFHANNHAEVIKNLGATPTKKIEPPDVKTTKENIEEAVKGETYERDVMYPDFIKVARADKNNAALKTFNYALAAEAEHAKLYSDALKNRETMKKAQVFYVCTVCGYTTAKIDFEKCPGCLNPKEKYTKVA